MVHICACMERGGSSHFSVTYDVCLYSCMVLSYEFMNRIGQKLDTWTHYAQSPGKGWTHYVGL